MTLAFARSRHARKVATWAMIDENLGAIILYGAFDGNWQLTSSPGCEEIRSVKLETLVPMCVTDARENRRTMHLRFSSWAVRRAGKGRRSCEPPMSDFFFYSFVRYAGLSSVTCVQKCITHLLDA